MGGALEFVWGKLSHSQPPSASLPPLVLFVSDGSNSGSDPLPWADRIKRMVSESGEASIFVTCGFGDVDRRLLGSLATSPEHYKDLRSPFELRRFLAGIGSTVTTVATEGGSASTVRSRILALIGKAA